MLPAHPIVGEAQFSRELTVTRYPQGEHWDSDGHMALVAEEKGEPIAFAHASFLAHAEGYEPVDLLWTFRLVAPPG